MLAPVFRALSLWGRQGSERKEPGFELCSVPVGEWGRRGGWRLSSSGRFPGGGALVPACGPGAFERGGQVFRAHRTE